MRQNGKFVAADASDNVRFAKGHFQNFTAANQKRISSNVTAMVINVLQAIHIGKEKKKWLFSAKREPNVVSSEKQKATPIVQTG